MPSFLTAAREADSLHQLGSSMASLPLQSLYCRAAEPSEVLAHACMCVQKAGSSMEW